MTGAVEQAPVISSESNSEFGWSCPVLPNDRFCSVKCSLNGLCASALVDSGSSVSFLN